MKHTIFAFILLGLFGCRTTKTTDVRFYPVSHFVLSEWFPNVKESLPSKSSEFDPFADEEADLPSDPIDLKPSLQSVGIDLESGETAVYLAKLGKVMVRASSSRHDAVASLLRSRQNAVQVEVEAQFYRVPAELVNDLQTRSLPFFVAHDETKLIAAPRITTLPGISAEISTQPFLFIRGEDIAAGVEPSPLPPDPGLRLWVMPVSVSPDQDLCELDLRFWLEANPGESGTPRLGKTMQRMVFKGRQTKVLGGFAGPKTPDTLLYAVVTVALVNGEGRPINSFHAPNASPTP